MPKQGLGISVLVAAQQRIAWTFDTFTKIYVSWSGGKDSTVMLHLVMAEAIKRQRRVGVLFVDLEGQYQLTIEHVQECFALYQDLIDPYWVALPLHLRNAVSMFETHWVCWEPGHAATWIRQPSALAITDATTFPFFRAEMEFEEFVLAFGQWYSDGELTACFVGIRADESLNRWRTIAGHGVKWREEDGTVLRHTNYLGKALWNCYPIYDWKVDDLWTYFGRTGRPYNHLYDRMYQAGLTLSQMRICQPYGDDQRRGLWLFHLIEPETWARVVARVNGANSGAEYVQQQGNVSGYGHISKPDEHTWQTFALLLLESLPPKTRQHFSNKIAQFVHWWQERGYPDGIPDEADPQEEAAKKTPSWRRICKMLLRNDHWAKGLSFSQQKSHAYANYQRLMEKRRAQWGIL